MDKFKNFLYYNKIKIISAIFVILAIIVTLNQCSENKKSDFGIMYAGEKSCDLKMSAEKLKSAVSFEDADSDGEINVTYKSLINPSKKNEAALQGVPEQIQVELISGENRLFLLDKETLEKYSVDENFAPITEFAKKYGIKNDDCLFYKDGRIYAVSLSGNKFLKECGIDTSGLYIAQRNYLSKDKDDIINKNTKKALEYIMKEGKSNEK